eukprot:TRINITY_DN1232_c0_g1_i4.p1 TRINITY_DN1232_c0_g1~~TRINITY_DN1232_c0_g1_i4.p1  ORF type:complete len:931 (-),score=167.43 TRINITY_DN1232_c0_g1_i4:142-2934(-)
MEGAPEDELESYSEKLPKVTFMNFKSLLTHGTKNEVHPPPEVPGTSLMTILYTSGSTGNPKGAVNSYQRWNSFITPLYLMPQPLVRISLAPLAHTTERQLTWLTLCFGGKQGFSQGDMSGLFTEFRMIKPTQLSAAPSVFSMLHGKFQTLLHLTIEEHRENGSDKSDAQIEAEVMEDFSSILGGNIKHLIIGGAASGNDLKIFLEKCFKCPVYDGYGATECGSIASNNKLFPNVKVRLESVPDMGYTTEDKPYPRGELFVSTPQMIEGYYKDSSTTEANFKQGWFRTGDIAEIREDGVFLIDRSSNVLKLPQGFFVSPSQIEMAALKSSFVKQIYVHGDIVHPFLVAIVVPELEVCRLWAKKELSQVININTLSEREFCDVPQVKSQILRSIARVCVESHLKSFEIPAAIWLEPIPFSPERGLMTVSLKPLPRAVAAAYKAQISEMFSQLDEKRKLTNNQVMSIVESILDAEGRKIESDDLFGIIGTDSLNAVRFLNTINSKFGKKISMSAFQNSASISDIANILVSDETFGDVEMQLREKNREALADLREFTEKEWKLIPLEMTQPATDTENIFVTGSTGFLGTFVLHDLLENPKVNKIFCLVRAKDSLHGLVRIKDTFKFRKLQWKDHYESKIEVVVGNLEIQYFGMELHEYLNLATRVDSIVHVAAIVNWVKAYSSMQSNVTGTAHVISFAFLGKLKRLCYVSTCSTDSFAEGDLLPESQAFQSGSYVLSKWISEKTVIHASHCGLPVVIVKPGMIAGHSVTGACNTTDFITKILAGIAHMKAAFTSSNKLEMIPVDFVAKITATISLDSEIYSSGATAPLAVHVTNPRTLTYTQVFEAAQNFGFDISVISYEDWREKLISDEGQNPLSSLLPFFAETQFSMYSPAYGRTNLEKYLREKGIEDCREASPEHVYNYLKYLVECGELTV